VREFASRAEFVLLIHPKEARNRIGTARMVKLCMPDSHLIEGRGQEFDQHPVLQGILRDPTRQPFLVYPARNAVQLDRLVPVQAEQVFDPSRRPVLVLIDGTWSQAKRMVRLSRILSELPALAFEPDQPSRYRIREQPGEFCLSTVEAVHTMLHHLDRLAVAPKKDPVEATVLLELFERMVEWQIDFEAEA
jgi:DTW domain-containing protein YfiP